LPDLDPESSPPDPDLNAALVMYIQQVIVSKKTFLTNFLKNCHDLDTM
jgi:hypothetical protein